VWGAFSLAATGPVRFPRLTWLNEAQTRVGKRLATTLVMLTLLLVLLLVALIGGGIGHSRFGYAGWSPAGLILLVVLVMLVTGTRL
jgi:hypothetical protein